jgi:cathepsin L
MTFFISAILAMLLLSTVSSDPIPQPDHMPQADQMPQFDEVAQMDPNPQADQMPQFDEIAQMDPNPQGDQMPQSDPFLSLGSSDEVLTSSEIPLLVFEEPNDVLSSPRFNSSKAAAWSLLFRNWATRSHRRYRSLGAERKASRAFKAAALAVMQHNAEYKAGLHSFAEGLNQYSDLSFDEFSKIMLTLTPPLESDPNSSPSSETLSLSSMEDLASNEDLGSLNYAEGHCVTPVKSQGGCGSCWAFTATGAMESAYCKRTGVLVSLSEEQLVNCVKESAGCDGGWMHYAYNYVKAEGGISTDDSYPYRAGTLLTESECEADPARFINMTLTYMHLRFGDDANLLKALKTIGPISVAVSVANGFYRYSSGVMDPREACGPRMNHAVLLVGYGVDEQTKLPYWLLKNSWGTSWGEDGYFRLNRKVNNSCFVSERASAVVIE